MNKYELAAKCRKLKDTIKHRRYIRNSFGFHSTIITNPPIHEQSFYRTLVRYNQQHLGQGLLDMLNDNFGDHAPLYH